MLTIQVTICPHCGAKVPICSGGFIYKPVTSARCPSCNKVFSVSLTSSIKGLVKRFKFRK